MSTIAKSFDSSAIQGIRYDTDTQELDVIFTNGETYTYNDVPAEEVERFLRAPSKGAFFHANITKYG